MACLIRVPTENVKQKMQVAPLLHPPAPSSPPPPLSAPLSITRLSPPRLSLSCLSLYRYDTIGNYSRFTPRAHDRHSHLCCPSVVCRQVSCPTSLLSTGGLLQNQYRGSLFHHQRKGLCRFLHWLRDDCGEGDPIRVYPISSLRGPEKEMVMKPLSHAANCLAIRSPSSTA